MQNIQNSVSVELLMSIIGGLILLLQFAFVFILKSIKNNIDDLWKRSDETSRDLNKLLGEHEALCKRKNDKT